MPGALLHVLITHRVSTGSALLVRTNSLPISIYLGATCVRVSWEAKADPHVPKIGSD